MLLTWYRECPGAATLEAAAGFSPKRVSDTRHSHADMGADRRQGGMAPLTPALSGPWRDYQADFGLSTVFENALLNLRHTICGRLTPDAGHLRH